MYIKDHSVTASVGQQWCWNFTHSPCNMKVKNRYIYVCLHELEGKTA